MRFKMLPLLFCLVFNLSFGLHADPDQNAAECKAMLNQKEANGAFKFWENSKQIKQTAAKAVLEFYLQKIREEGQELNLQNKCKAEINALEALNKKSYTKAFVGSSSRECLRILKQSCNNAQLIGDKWLSQFACDDPDALKKAIASAGEDALLFHFVENNPICAVLNRKTISDRKAIRSAGPIPIATMENIGKGMQFGSISIGEQLTGGASSPVFSATLNGVPVIVKMMYEEEVTRTTSAENILDYAPLILAKSSVLPGGRSWVVLEKIEPFEYSVEASRALFTQLATMHRNDFVHSDISMGNVMGKGSAATFIDFGLAQLGTRLFSMNRFKDPKQSDLVALGRVLLAYSAEQTGEMKKFLDGVYESLIKPYGFRKMADRDAVQAADSGKEAFIKRYSSKSLGSLYHDDVLKDLEIYRYYLKKGIVNEGQDWSPSTINMKNYASAETELNFDHAKAIFDGLISSESNGFARFLHKVAVGGFLSVEAAIKDMPPK